MWSCSGAITIGNNCNGCIAKASIRAFHISHCSDARSNSHWCSKAAWKTHVSSSARPVNLNVKRSYVSQMLEEVRVRQLTELSHAIQSGEKMIIVSGPVSSGKTTSIRHVIHSTEGIGRYAHVFCETGDLIPDILTDIANQLTGSEHKRRSVSSIAKLVDACKTEDRTIIVLDSFDLLEKTAIELYKRIEAMCECNMLPTATIIIVAHVNPVFLSLMPMDRYHIHFPAYNKEEIAQIVCATLNDKDESRTKTIIDICLPMTYDLRDIIFVVHTIGDEHMRSAAALGKRILGILDTMRAQQISRVNDLAKTAAAIVIAMYIASRTSVTSDYFRFTRTKEKRKKKMRLLEEHEMISVERVFALAKAIIQCHMDGFDTDFSMNMQLEHLIELGLVEMRGDPFGEPRVKCLATEQEVVALAKGYDIRLQEYLSEM